MPHVRSSELVHRCLWRHQSYKIMIRMNGDVSGRHTHLHKMLGATVICSFGTTSTGEDSGNFADGAPGERNDAERRHWIWSIVDGMGGIVELMGRVVGRHIACVCDV